MMFDRKEYMKGWRQRRRERNKLYMRKYRAEHLEEVRAAQNKNREEIRARVLNKLGGKCILCGKSTGRLQVHHIKRRCKFNNKPTLKDLTEKSVALLCYPCHATLTRLSVLKTIGTYRRALRLVSSDHDPRAAISKGIDAWKDSF